MRLLRVGTLIVVTLTAASLSGAGSSAGADSVDVGSTPGLPSQVNLSCAAGTTFFQDATATAPGYTTPDGVVTSFSTMAISSGPGTVALRTAREGPNDTYTITGASEAHQLVAGRLNSFLTRLPVRAGEVIALHLPPGTGGAGCGFGTSQAGDVLRYRAGSGFTDPVGTVVATNAALANSRIDLSARVEPDADADGYGDLTQDACPTLRNSHDDCTPPDTFLKSGPAKKLVITGKATKVKIVFFASEPGSTFTCQLDRAAPAACNTTFKTKVGRGRHKVTMIATDQVGNVDPTPLVVGFKVVRRTA